MRIVIPLIAVAALAGCSMFGPDPHPLESRYDVLLAGLVSPRVIFPVKTISRAPNRALCETYNITDNHPVHGDVRHGVATICQTPTGWELASRTMQPWPGVEAPDSSHSIFSYLGL